MAKKKNVKKGVKKVEPVTAKKEEKNTLAFALAGGKTGKPVAKKQGKKQKKAVAASKKKGSAKAKKIKTPVVNKKKAKGKK